MVVDFVRSSRDPSNEKRPRLRRVKLEHHPHCDCPRCNERAKQVLVELLDEFPNPPPLLPVPFTSAAPLSVPKLAPPRRMRTPSPPPRPPRGSREDLRDDFDEVDISIPDHVLEKRKLQRRRDRETFAEETRRNEALRAYLKRAESIKSARDPVEVSEELFEELRRHPMLTGRQVVVNGGVRVLEGPDSMPVKTLMWSDRRSQSSSIGSDGSRFAQGPVKKRPDLQRTSTVLSSKAQLGYHYQPPPGSGTNTDTTSVRSVTSNRSLRPYGRRNLQGQVIARSTTSERRQRLSTCAPSSVSSGSSSERHLRVAPCFATPSSSSFERRIKVSDSTVATSSSSVRSERRDSRVSESVVDDSHSPSRSRPQAPSAPSRSYPPISYKEAPSLRSRRLRESSPSPSSNDSIRSQKVGLPTRSGQGQLPPSDVLAQRQRSMSGSSQSLRNQVHTRGLSKSKELPVLPSISSGEPYPSKF